MRIYYQRICSRVCMYVCIVSLAVWFPSKILNLSHKIGINAWEFHTRQQRKTSSLIISLRLMWIHCGGCGYVVVGQFRCQYNYYMIYFIRLNYYSWMKQFTKNCKIFEFLFTLKFSKHSFQFIYFNANSFDLSEFSLQQSLSRYVLSVKEIYEITYLLSVY